MTDQMTSLQRVLTSLGHKEPDRVPFFLLLTLHGARELGLSIKEYLSNPENLVEGQLRMRKKYRHDCLLPFFYAAMEVEAFGGEVVFFDDGPPNSGEPILRKPGDIKSMKIPDIPHSPCLQKVLETTRMLKEKTGDEVPILGLAISPFSLPIMQMGFSGYLELMYEQPDLFWRLMDLNSEFCVNWANAQLKAGATAICYFDPVSSPTLIPREKFLETGFTVAQKVIARINGPTGIHLASGNCLSILEDLSSTGTAMVGCSSKEDISLVKKACQGKLTVLGNLNGVEMRRWTPGQAEEIVKQTILSAASGGGFILSDNHGEIPWQVGEDILMAISEAVHKWGRYPLEVF